jgi:hypothetical protein
LSGYRRIFSEDFPLYWVYDLGLEDLIVLAGLRLDANPKSVASIPDIVTEDITASCKKGDEL